MQGKNEYPQYGPEVKLAFRTQRSNAKKRGIGFLFSLPEWVDWWGDDLARRGLKPDQLVMARRGDAGPYHPDNVYKCASAESLATAPRMAPAELSRRAIDRHVRRALAGHPSHLAVRGDGHPRSKAVLTPAGRFGSAALAAEHYGITRAGLCHRIKSQPDSYRYE